MKILRQIALLLSLGAGVAACDVPPGTPKVVPSDSIWVPL
jgi:hypothetical protein